MSKELADVIVTAAVALDTVSGDGAAVVDHQLQGRVEEETRAAGETRLLQVLAINGDLGEIAIAVCGALGTGPHGESAEVTHQWEDVEMRLGRLILTAAALDDVTGCCLGHGVIRYFADAHVLVGCLPPPRWEMTGRRVGDDHGVVLQSGARKCWMALPVWPWFSRRIRPRAGSAHPC
ncbi:hypothetical protein [Streptomyces muensis]|uniref:Uncharacterized protein n=1 Tax=Streptomyces muensis TaxID=1077944 RepID=A0A9X1PWX4_STRM4|nr:hypothetical protein [Streptomyces muensis]MCF1594990.1 hypothetical protein [Streptomyces muensis]